MGQVISLNDRRNRCHVFACPNCGREVGFLPTDREAPCPRCGLVPAGKFVYKGWKVLEEE